MSLRCFGTFCLAVSLTACGPSRSNGEESYGLPKQLKEISGLAVAGPDSVFAHDDEYAIIYEIRLRDGRVQRVFALGEPTLEGDFEGIATAEGRVFLVTSDGLIYSALPGENGKRVAYHVFDSGIGPRCEVEGLSQAPARGELLLLCKRFRNKGRKALLEIFRWKIDSAHAEREPFLSISLKGSLDKDEYAKFRPSGLEYDFPSRRLYIISARNRMLLTLSQTGELLDIHKFKDARHPQAEGITIMPDGRLVISDEGSPTRAGQLTVYPTRRVKGMLSGASGTP